LLMARLADATDATAIISAVPDVETAAACTVDTEVSGIVEMVVEASDDGNVAALDATTDDDDDSDDGDNDDNNEEEKEAEMVVEKGTTDAALLQLPINRSSQSDPKKCQWTG
jgi:hypothetical protein